MDIIYLSDYTEEEIEHEVEEVDEIDEELKIIQKNEWVAKIKKIRDIFEYGYNIYRYYGYYKPILPKQFHLEKLKMFIELCGFAITIDEVRDKLINKRAVKRSEKILSEIYDVAYYYVKSRYELKINSSSEVLINIPLSKLLSEDLSEAICTKALELTDKVEKPNKQTREYFNITENWYSLVWWDQDGKIRENEKIGEVYSSVITDTPSRDTLIWEIYESKRQIIKLYKKILDIIYSTAYGKEKVKWKKKSLNVLQKIFHPFYEYKDSKHGKILSSLIKIIENSVRKQIPSFQILNTELEEKNIRQWFPKETTEEIFALLEEKCSDDDIDKICDSIVNKNPNNSKLKVEIIQKKGIDKLIEYNADENIEKILKALLKRSDDENIRILSMYKLDTSGKLIKKDKKELYSIIHESNKAIYENMVKENREISKELLKDILSLKDPIRKTIELDMDKVHIAKKELNTTIDIVLDYVDNSEEIKEEQKEDKIEIKTKKYKYQDFLINLLNKGSLSVEKVKKEAIKQGMLLNSYISAINEEFFEDVQDQLIVIEDNVVKIDEYYIDIAKELVNDSQ